MRAFLIILFIFFLFKDIAKSQNFTTREHCFITDLIFNPSIAGTQDDIIAVLSSKKNWIGLKDSPGTTILNIHAKASDLGFSKPKQYISNISTRIGLGLSLYNDINGPLSTNGIQVAYAYHILLKNNMVFSMGASTKITQYILDQTIFKPIDNDDPFITWNKEKIIIPNFNFGINLHNEKIHIGLSSTNLADFNTSNSFFTNGEYVRTLYLSGGYKFMLNNSSLFEPNLLIRSMNNKVWIDATVKYYYKKYFWFGLGWASSNLYSTYIAIKYNKFDFGYVFEYSLSPIYKYSFGNHMIFIGYNL